MTPEEILHHYWGYSSFRPLQREVIDSVLEGHDSLALLPTGGGKSICYQVPALMLEGTTIVVSPLISLMKDQVNQLEQRGIKAACLVSGMNNYEKEIVLNQCLYGNIKLLYVSPERLKSNTFLAHLRQMKVNLIVVDEAHCISQWGYDFRPPYLEIAAIRTLQPQATILAVTATATPNVATDIKLKLKFRREKVFQSNFARENISYMVLHETDKIGRIKRIIQKVGGCGIVYVRNRKKTEEIARTLNENGISALSYHAGLPIKERDKRQQDWMEERAQIMVATNAFGMGIDKSNVRQVVHLDIPDSLEAYFQEAGRAGRDGKPSFAVLLYEENDFERLDYSFKQSYPSAKYIKNVYRAICNFYQIPIGAGYDQQYDFQLESICSNYGFEVVPFYSATRFIEREGLLTIPSQEETISSIYIPISREELYRFQLDNHRFGEILTVILRLYGGIFTEFVKIDEKSIAKRCNTTEKEICAALEKLNLIHIVSYKRKNNKPQIIFSSPRIESESITLNDSNYKFLKETAAERINAIKKYVKETDVCRSKMLLAYFGEENVDNCHKCDICRLARKEGDTNQDVPSLIRAALTSKQMTIKELVLQFPSIMEKDIVEKVREMVDEGDIEINQDLLMRCKSS